jgi:hypothetical protein
MSGIFSRFHRESGSILTFEKGKGSVSLGLLEPKKAARLLAMVGATGIEPVTPPV